MQVLRCLPNQKIHTLSLTVSLGRGGEACVYTVPTDTSLVAKIYHKPSDKYARKLEVMLAHPPENPTASIGHISIAWPQELLKAADGSDRVIGFLMPRIRGMRPIIDFYNPRTRRQHCPLFSYQYLVRTARNLAAAFASLHASGYCVGDVNESNILVSDTALVTIVDTDSFQVRDPENEMVYRCPVGKPEFTPPELQNKTFSQCDRAIAHDLFGLGVLIFQLLMEGTHPFSGIYQGVGEPPAYESRIAAGHFTYSNKHRVPYTPTPIAPSWQSLHPALQELFQRCFEEGHTNPLLRPSAATWMLTLAEVEESLHTCDANQQHQYSQHLDKCPWCERAVRLGGRDPFPSPAAVAAKEHLQPIIRPRRRRYAQTRFVNTGTTLQRLQNQTQIHYNNLPYYKPVKKAKLYPAILCVFGFGLLGYLDFTTKFTSSLFAPTPYNQQTLAIAQREQAKQNTPKPPFDVSYQQGHASYQVRDYESAIARFSDAISQDPKYAKAYVNRGNARYNLKEYEGAISDYNQALRLNPREIKAFVNRGNVRYTLAEYSSDPDKEYRLALSDFNNAIQLNPKEVEAYIRRGIVRSQIAKYSGDSQADYRLAIADFNQAISLNGSRPEPYFQRGLVRYQVAQYSSNFESEYKLAIADFDQALKINHRLSKVYLKRGIVHYELAQYGGKEAKTHKMKSVEDLQLAAKISLEQENMDDYQQALSSICVVVENKCDTLFQPASMNK